MSRLRLALLLSALAIAGNASAQSCPGSPVAVQILGSGGPAVVGRVAQSAGVGRLVLSHIGSFDLNAAVAEVRSTYAGALTVGADLQCTPVP